MVFEALICPSRNALQNINNILSVNDTVSEVLETPLEFRTPQIKSDGMTVCAYVWTINWIMGKTVRVYNLHEK